MHYVGLWDDVDVFEERVAPMFRVPEPATVPSCYA